MSNPNRSKITELDRKAISAAAEVGILRMNEVGPLGPADTLNRWRLETKYPGFTIQIICTYKSPKSLPSLCSPGSLKH